MRLHSATSTTTVNVDDPVLVPITRNIGEQLNTGFD